MQPPPLRSEGWVDIFEQEETTKAKIARIAKHAEQLSKDALAKIVNGMERYQQLENATKRMQKHPPARMDLSWPMMRYVAPVGRAPGFMTPEMIAAVGVSTRPRRKWDRSTDAEEVQPTNK